MPRSAAEQTDQIARLECGAVVTATYLFKSIKAVPQVRDHIDEQTWTEWAIS
jgi:hypothetical protein